MSYLSKQQRLAFIHSRLKHKRDYPSAITLSNDFEREFGEPISSKSIQRDIEQLKIQMAPIEYDRKQRGYFYTEESYDFTTGQLQSSDFLTLLVIERAMSSYKNSPYYKRLSKIFDQIKTALPEKVSISNNELISHMSIIPEPTSDINSNLWTEIEKGLTQHLMIKIKYKSPHNPDTKIYAIEPYHLAGHKGEWYLIAKHNSKIKIFNLSRMQDCTLTTDRFEYPAKFNVEDYFDPQYGIYINEEKVEIKIRFDYPTSNVIKEKIWHEDQKIVDLDNGSIMLTFTTNQQSQTLYWVSQWGEYAEIIEPQSLRDRMKNRLLKTVSMY